MGKNTRKGLVGVSSGNAAPLIVNIHGEEDTTIK